MITQRLVSIIETVRRLLPARWVPLVVRLRVAIAWSRPSVRADARAQMDLLVGVARPEVDLERLARAYVESQVARAESRWHLSLVTDQRLEGLEHLTAARDLGRGVLVTFMHHGQYDGMLEALEIHGVHCTAMSYPYILTDEAPSWLKQHLLISEAGGSEIVSTDVGIKGIVEQLSDGDVFVIACDVPGSTPVTFAGRTLTGSSGMAYAASAGNSPVVVLTGEVDEQGPHQRAHPPLYPADFADPPELLRQVLAIHEEAVLRTPERYDLPLARWGVSEPAPAS